jgi:Ser/Thr protein kinase RdoA (MazF antagonist)
MLDAILELYGFDSKEWIVEPFGNGLINHTWRLHRSGEEYIVQRINHNVFKDPYAISDNIQLVGEYLRHNFPGYFFVTPIRSKGGSEIVANGDGYFRIFPFVKNSITYTTVENPELAFEAARQFARFTHNLSGFNPARLKETIPDFHNISLRFAQFSDALAKGNKERIATAADVIGQVEKYRYIVADYEKIKVDARFRKRVMHHDTKISNILFDKQNQGLCVIDLDTVMPGFFISDVGDMMRTYLAAVSEEETDFSRIEVREEYCLAIVQGYLSEMQADLTAAEKKAFIYAGKFMIYMQLVRFLADYLVNDQYYGSTYEGQNLNRAINQLYLLRSLEEKEEKLQQKIGSITGAGSN